ncbi:hypothetical protein Pcinc_044245 [Petrolisthes cinctipes]|uniref:Uncharacterized protein n=1 Tax=Petrolisthes cinctipes TaxID=88211 RepID=A0AAE1EFK1_PETCI|nr:hypothetical protein Pcinc_044245 [Petrolisthes cinctipes]
MMLVCLACGCGLCLGRREDGGGGGGGGGGDRMVVVVEEREYGEDDVVERKRTFGSGGGGGEGMDVKKTGLSPAQINPGCKMWEFPECVKININDLGVSVRKVRMDYVRILMHLYLGNSCLLLTGGSICLLRDAPTHPEAQPRGGKVDLIRPNQLMKNETMVGGGGAVRVA